MGIEVCKQELKKALAQHLGLKVSEITDEMEIPLDFDLLGFFESFVARHPSSCGIFSSDDFRTVGDITNSASVS